MVSTVVAGNEAAGADSGVDDDGWARDFFQRLLAQRLSRDEFDAAVAERWASGRFIVQAPGCVHWLRGLALRQQHDAGYGHDAEARFSSCWLAGEPGRPAAIHVQAPAELKASALLRDKNRRPHHHDSARITLITRGQAVLHLLRTDARGQPQRLDCPVQEGALIFWPAHTTHTFDALHGFWLLSAMSEWVSPAADGFGFEPEAGQPCLDTLPPLAYADHLRTL